MSPHSRRPGRKRAVFLAALFVGLAFIILSNPVQLSVSEETTDSETMDSETTAVAGSRSGQSQVPSTDELPGLPVIISLGLLVMAFIMFSRAYPRKEKH